MHRRYAEAESACERGLAYSETHDLDIYLVPFHVRHGYALLETGRWDAVDALIAAVQQAASLSRLDATGLTTLQQLIDLRRGRARSEQHWNETIHGRQAIPWPLVLAAAGGLLRGCMAARRRCSGAAHRHRCVRARRDQRRGLAHRATGVLAPACRRRVAADHASVAPALRSRARRRRARRGARLGRDRLQLPAGAGAARRRCRRSSPGARPAPRARCRAASSSCWSPSTPWSAAWSASNRPCCRCSPKDEFGLTGYTFIFTYVVAFGITKAAANYFAGTWSDRYGRKPVLIVGWLFAVPVPLMLIWAPSWGWVVAANVLLGINQGLTWSTTVIMKIDLVGPRQRGLAMGLNEAAGYGAVAAHLPRRRLPRRRARPAPRAVPARPLLHRPRPRPLDAGGAGDPRACPGRGRGPCAARRRSARPPARRAEQPRGVRPDQPPRARALFGEPGRAGQQPQLRALLGTVPAPVRGLGNARRADRRAVRALPRRVGRRTAVHRGLVGPVGPQAPDHRRDAHPGERPGRDRGRRHVRPVGRGHDPARRRHRDGLPDPARRHRRRRPPRVAGPRRRRSTGSGETSATPSAP